MFSALYTSYKATLEDLRDCLIFIDKSIKLRPRIGSMLNWDQIDGDSKSLAQSFMENRDIRSSLLFSALFVETHASFEQYIRSLVEAAISNLNSKGGIFADFDEDIIKQNIALSGSLLSSIHQPYDYLKIDFHELCKTLGTCYPGSTNTKLNPTAFSFFTTSLSSIHMEKILSRLRICVSWDTFGRSSKLQKLFGQSKTRETAKNTTDYLDKMVKIRNHIAHTGSSAATVDYLTVDYQLQFISVFCEILNGIVSSSISSPVRA